MRTFEESVERNSFARVLDQAKSKRIALMKCGQLHCPCCYPEMSARLRASGDYLATELASLSLSFEMAAAREESFRRAKLRRQTVDITLDDWQSIDIYDLPAGAD